jgi:hypothetical protein
LAVAIGELRMEVTSLRREIERMRREEIAPLRRSVDMLTRQTAKWKGGLGLLLILGGVAGAVASALGWTLDKH